VSKNLLLWSFQWPLSFPLSWCSYSVVHTLQLVYVEAATDTSSFAASPVFPLSRHQHCRLFKQGLDLQSKRHAEGKFSASSSSSYDSEADPAISSLIVSRPKNFVSHNTTPSLIIPQLRPFHLPQFNPQSARQVLSFFCSRIDADIIADSLLRA
jgi:hypothetical protein